MVTLYLPVVNSTQLYLLEGVKKGVLNLPVGVWSSCQTAGIGSRGNRWEGRCGNLFLSVGVWRDQLPPIPPQSYSLYFGWLMLELLRERGSRVVLKWPNDLYLIGEGKVGGILTSVGHRGGRPFLVVGVGVNTHHPVPPFPKLDLPIENREVVEGFIEKIENPPSWEEVFQRYRREFYLHRGVLGIEGELTEFGELKVGAEVRGGWR